MAASKIDLYKKTLYDDSHQVSPAWMVTFVRFHQRSEQKKNPVGANGLATRPIMPVISDCISLTVSQTKGNFAHSAEMTLVSGDINYMTAVAPGDYFLVNMVEDEGRIPDLYNRAKNAKPINGYNDGFKGIFKIQSVHQMFQIAGNGEKRLVYRVTGYAFGEFNNTIYFNPFLVQEYMTTPLFFLTAISDGWNKKVKDGTYNSVQNIILALYDAFVGKAIKALAGGELQQGLEKTPNRPYELPADAMKLMGCKGSNSCDIINVISGKQDYRVSSSPDEANRLMPILKNVRGRHYTTNKFLEGHSYAKPEYFSQIKVWDILNQYLNGTINEMFTTFKPDPSGNGLVLPSLIIREKPFTTNQFASQHPNEGPTAFLSLPRWTADYDKVEAMNLGRDDAARFNFVQIFGRSQSNSPNASIAFQTKAGNYEFDKEDIRRSGLRPFVATIPYDYQEATSQTVTVTPYWATLVSDWLLGGHLKISGTVSMVGIEKPVSVGDNFQLGDIVYHIESISHSGIQGMDGSKTFKSSLQLSSGVLDDDSKEYVPYAEMEYTAADSYRDDFSDRHPNVLPGVSDSQDLPGDSKRDKGERKSGKENLTKEQSFIARDGRRKK